MVCYQFYAVEYGGSTLTESDFGTYEPRAAAIINGLTYWRITRVTDDIKRAVCAVAEELQRRTAAAARSGNGAVTSEKVGDVSVSYNAAASDAMSDEAMAAYYKLALLYIKDRRLLERGCCH